jgi:cytochrome d ubiquinol oxidase subunit I
MRGWERAPRWFLWITFLSFPSGFIAVFTGWFTAEVGRQPWVVFGLLRTADAVTPSLTVNEAWASLIAFVTVYALIFSAGTLYIYRLLRVGPGETVEAPKTRATALRPMAAGGRNTAAATRQTASAGE